MSLTLPCDLTDIISSNFWNVLSSMKSKLKKEKKQIGTGEWKVRYFHGFQFYSAKQFDGLFCTFVWISN